MLSKISSIKQTVKELKNRLTQQEQDLIYFNSVENFVIYLDKFDNEIEKRKVIELIESYLKQIEENNFSFSRNERKEILQNFINPIAFYYIHKFRFKLYIKLRGLIFMGLNIDIILLIFGVLKNIYFIPIATLILFAYWLYIKIFYVSKNKVY